MQRQCSVAVVKKSDPAQTFPSPINPKMLYFQIGRRDLAEGAREAYSEYAFDVMLKLFNNYPENYENRFQFVTLYWQYFASSYANRMTKHLFCCKAWMDALWEIRQTCGSDFTDRSLMQASSFLDDPNFESNGAFDLFFYLRFRYGEQVVNNDWQKILAADKILQTRGLLKSPDPASK
jgi:hypothetical protein